MVTCGGRVESLNDFNFIDSYASALYNAKQDYYYNNEAKYFNFMEFW